MLFSLKTNFFLNHLFCTYEIAVNTVESLAADGNSDRYIKNRRSENNIKYEIKSTKTVALNLFFFNYNQFQ